MAMTTEENSESKSNTKEPPFKKITFNTDYKMKTTLEEPPMDLKLKPLPDNLEYAFLEEPYFLSIQLNELNELRDHAYENSMIYKEKTKRIHDSKIKNRVFNVGDQVLLFNSRLKIFSGKLKSRWGGPFTIAKVFPYGTGELSQANGPSFKVNGHRIKHYFGGDVPQLVVPDLQTSPRSTLVWGDLGQAQ
nr:reverse transcriptase domain-containing protein [Tanacetum cinerariifolium]